MGKGRWALGERGRLKASRDLRMRRRDAWMGDVGEGSCTRVVRASRKTGGLPGTSTSGRAVAVLNCYQQPEEQTMRAALERRAMAVSNS